MYLLVLGAPGVMPGSPCRVPMNPCCARRGDELPQLCRRRCFVARSCAARKGHATCMIDCQYLGRNCELRGRRFLQRQYATVWIALSIRPTCATFRPQWQRIFASRTCRLFGSMADVCWHHRHSPIGTSTLVLPIMPDDLLRSSERKSRGDRIGGAAAGWDRSRSGPIGCRPIAHSARPGRLPRVAE